MSTISIKRLFVFQRLFVAIMGVTLISSASFCQNVTVDLLTGSPSVSIPIYNLSIGKISVPVGIQYGAGAHRVLDGEGEAGLGWNLTCTAGVYRQVRGLPDDVVGTTLTKWTDNASSINAFTPTSNDAYSSTTETDEDADYNFINGQGYTKDSEPDLYTVSAPGLFFQFVFDAAGVPRPLSYQDVKIVKDDANSFTVKNNTGTTYTFAWPELVTRKSYVYKSGVPDMFTTEYNFYNTGTYNPGIPFVQAWKVTAITDSEGNQVNYTYKSLLQPIGQSDYKIRIKTTNVKDTLYSITDVGNPSYIDKITAGNYKVSFTWSGSNLLTSLKVEDIGLNDVKEYQFKYTSAKSNSDTKQPYLYKSFLMAVQPFVQCTSQEPYKFSYQGLTPASEGDKVDNFDMPWKSRLNQDFFGYYNGVSGNTNIPQIYYYSGATDNRRFSLRTISGPTLTQTLTGTTRSVSSAKVGMGALSKVTYPTGGSTQIIYERNKYFDSNTGQVSYGPGQRVASVISSGGEAGFGRDITATNPYHQLRKDYVYSKSDNDTTTSGVLMYPPVLAFAIGTQLIRTPYDLGYSSPVSYSRVKEKVSGQGATVSEFSLPAAYPSTTYSTDWTATRSRIARNPTHRIALSDVQNGYYTFPFAPNPNYEFERGLLVRQSEYAETGSLVRERKLQYTRISPSLQTISGLKFEKLTDCDCFHFSKYQVITGTTKVLTKEIISEVSESASADTLKTTKYYHYNADVANNNFLMDSVRTVFGDGTVARSKVKYVKDFAAITSPTPGDPMANAIKQLITANRHGEVVEQYSSFKRDASAEVMTGSVLTAYKDFGSGKILPDKVYQLPAGASFTPAAVITGATQGFSYDNVDYELVSSFDEYDATGRPVAITDNKKNSIAYHHASSYSLAPVAAFNNVTTPQQTIYEGFEFATGRNLTSTGAIAYDVGWTGERSLILPAGRALYNNSSTTINNAGVPYRVSLWIKGTGTNVLTIKFYDASNTSVTVTSGSLNYTTPNQWAYLEGILNVTSSTPATLKFEITTPGTVSLDDIIVMPQTGTVSTQTFLPLKGATSQTDDRGNSTKVVYDGLGRKVNVFDRQRNLVELDEYKNLGVAKASLIPGIDVPSTPIYVDQYASFTSTVNNTCGLSLSYEWRLDGNVVGTLPYYGQTFTQPGSHSIELKVTNTATLEYEVKQPIPFCVYLPIPNVSFNFNVNKTSITTCDVNIPRFTISGFTPTSGSSITYSWSYSTDGGTSWTPIAATTGPVDFSPPIVANYIVKVAITATASNNDNACMAQSLSATNSQQLSVTYTNGTNCQ